MLFIALLIILIIILLLKKNEHMTNEKCVDNWSGRNYFVDESCLNGGVGCNAFGHSNLRFCGGNGEIQCPTTKCNDTKNGCYNTSPSGNYYIEPKCGTFGGGLGCNAVGGEMNTRFCGGSGDFSSIKCPSQSCSQHNNNGNNNNNNSNNNNSKNNSSKCYNMLSGQKYFKDETCENGGVGCNLFGNRLLRECDVNGISCPSKICQESIPKAKRTFKFVNNRNDTIYVGSQCDPKKNIKNEIIPNGWKMNPKEIKLLELDSNLTSIRFWARTGCSYDSSGMLNCNTGNCPLPSDKIIGSEKGVECNGIGGIPPASLVEFTLSPIDKGTDYYDISLVDGHNVDISIIPSDYTSAHLSQNNSKYDCGSPKIKFDKEQCPEELLMKDENGKYIGCASICTAINNEKQRKKFKKLQDIYNGKTKDGKPMRDLVCCSCGNNNGGCNDPNSNYCCSPYTLPGQITGSRGGVCRVEEWPTVCPMSESYCPDGTNNCSPIERLCKVNGETTKIPYRYDRVFKNSCPDAYSWQFDDLNSTYQCSNANYTIIFN